MANKIELISKFPDYVKLIKDQFEYGAKKYATSNIAQKEATDCLFDTFGKNWLFGTMAKYVYRYKNVKRERDLLKICGYCYILFLKRGFWVQTKGVDSPIIYINTDLKTNKFDDFIIPIESYLKEKSESFRYYISQSKTNESSLKTTYLERVNKILEHCAFSEWKEVSISDLEEIFLLCFLEWYDSEYYKVKIPDTDTWNEGK